jgi:hypothetical protein
MNWIVGSILLAVLVSCEKSEPYPYSCPNCTGGGECTPPKDVLGDKATAEVGDASFALSDCQKCLQKGACYRFSDLVVTEPSEPPGLPPYLNNIWQQDVKDFRLNIVLCLREVVQVGDMMVVQFEAGGAWHDLPFDKVMDLNHSNVPSWYQFIEGSTSLFTAIVFKDCTLETQSSASLLFHSGPKDHPLICAPGLGGLPQNIIPIVGLVATAHVDDTCEAITSGHLSGCISHDAACQICSWMPAPNYKQWKIDGKEDVPEQLCDATLCQHYCGEMWANFAQFVEGIHVPFQCDTDGNGEDDGYRLAGNFVATRVQEKPASQ